LFSFVCFRRLIYLFVYLFVLSVVLFVCFICLSVIFVCLFYFFVLFVRFICLFYLFVCLEGYRASAMCWHRVAMDDLHAKLVAPKPIAPRARNKKYRTPHLAFIAITRQEEGLSLDQPNAAWAQLSIEQRSAYDVYVRQPGEPIEPKVVNDTRCFETQSRDVSVAQLGTSRYPLNADFACEATADIEKGVDDWAKVVGGLFTSADDVIAPLVYQCSETYGFGRCCDDFTEAEQNAFKELGKYFVAMARRPGRITCGRTTLNLFSVRLPDAPAGHADAVPNVDETIVHPVCPSSAGNLRSDFDFRYDAPVRD